MKSIHSSSRLFVRQQYGVSLVELMIGMAMGLLVILAISSLFLSSHRTDKAQEAMSRVQENARYGFEALGRAFRHAGYRPNPVLDFINQGGMSVEYGFPVATIGGFAFLGAESLRGTDSSFAIRYRGDADGLGRDCTGAAVPVLNAGGTDSTTEVWDVSGGNLRCGVYRAGVQVGSTQTIIENVGQLNLFYGENATKINTRERDADTYRRASTVANWTDVVAVRVEFLLESSDNVTTAPQTYKFNNVTTTPTDTRLRRVYNATFAVRNIR